MDLNSTLKEGSARSGSGLRQNKARGLLVVAELALAVVLLIGAGLLIRTFTSLRSVVPGFDAHNVFTMETALTGTQYDRTAGISLKASQVLERLQAIPGVETAAASSYLPLEGGLGRGFIIEGRPLTNGPAHGGAGWNYVTAHFFDCFKIPVVRGRIFTDRDDAAAAPVVVINQAMARQYWKGQDPIGQRLIIGSGMGPNFLQPTRQIIGVVGDARDGGLNNDPQPETFVPLSQMGDAYMALNNAFMPLNWLVRTRVAPFSVLGQVRSAFQQAAGLPVSHVRSMDQIVEGSTARDQFNTLLLGIFAFFAILLASIRLYGLMAYSVEQRTLEFGIRLALGADFPRLRNMVVKQAMTLAMVGIVIGLGAAYGLTRVMVTLLYQVEAHRSGDLRLGSPFAGGGSIPGVLSSRAARPARGPRGCATAAVAGGGRAKIVRFGNGNDGNKEVNRRVRTTMVRCQFGILDRAARICIRTGSSPLLRSEKSAPQYEVSGMDLARVSGGHRCRALGCIILVAKGMRHWTESPRHGGCRAIILARFLSTGDRLCLLDRQLRGSVRS